MRGSFAKAVRGALLYRLQGISPNRRFGWDQ